MSRRVQLLQGHLTGAAVTQTAIDELKQTINAAVQATEASERSKYSEQEWALRVDLAAAYQIAAHYGWDEVIYNHITVRVPGTEEHFLINPFGLHFAEITASSLVKIGPSLAVFVCFKFRRFLIT
jgi:hypothetical protein